MSAFQPLDPAQREASAMLLALHHALEKPPVRAPSRPLLGRLLGKRPVAPIPGMYLWGGVGRGKTHLMDWFVRDLPSNGKRRLHFHHFMRDIHARLRDLPKQPDPLQVIARQWCDEARVLCLDEFLVTDITDAMILHGLLSALFARGLTLVTTANTAPDDLYRNGLQRSHFLPAIDLIKRHTRVFELAGTTDYRLRTLVGTGIYPEPGSIDQDVTVADSTVSDDSALEAADARLARVFSEMSGGSHPPSAGLLSVNARSFPVKGRCGDVLWVDFEVLCGTHRSVGDYIEIARAFHTLLLSGVPILGPSCEAAARRFVHLVDELYDQRVRLIFSSSAPVRLLYAGGLIDFPHERLLSRLVEMQSPAYLANPRARGGN